MIESEGVYTHVINEESSPIVISGSDDSISLQQDKDHVMITKENLELVIKTARKVCRDT